MEHARPPAELCLEGGPACRAEAWEKWLRQFRVFLKASGVEKEPESVKSSLMVNLIGAEGYDIYTTFKFIRDENKECTETLVKKFNEHFGAKQNTTMARFKFFSRNQEEGESIDEYVTALKILSQRCEFELLEEGLIRDRIVCGVQDGKLRDRLLRADDLTLSKAVKICQANEMSTEEQKQIEGTKTQVVAVDVMNARGLNVISLNTFKKIGFKMNILSSDNTKAQSFCGNFIPIAGYCNLKCLYKNTVYTIRFIVADFNCQSVLGKYACEELGMVQRILFLNVNEYADLFQGLGKLPGEYNIVMEQYAQPSVCPVRKIPIGVRDKLLQELGRMEKMGVNRKVSHPTPWVNSIVVASKKDGSIRVCLDPRPLNRVVQRAHYPLPTLSEIATKLEGAQVFSKLDARSGFWMIQLDDASADLCTFGTPFGRFQFLRLPYGINCASEVFHSKIRQFLEDLEGVDSFVRWRGSRAHRPAREPLIPHQIPSLPWAKVGSDIFQYAGKYFMLLVDYFSNYIEVNPLSNIGTKAVLIAMRDQFARHGIPQELITDNGPAYASKEFTDFCKLWEIKHITSSPNYAQSNGQSERSVQIIKNILIKSIKSGTNFYLGLLNYRATPRNGISSPSELLFGRRLNTRLPSHENKLKPGRDNEKDYKEMLRKQQSYKAYYDRRAKPLPEISPGQPVIIADEGHRKYARIVGPTAHPRSYFVTDVAGKKYRRNRRHLVKLQTDAPVAQSAPSPGSSRAQMSDDEIWDSPTSISEYIPDKELDSNSDDDDLNSSDNANIQRARRQAAVLASEKIRKAL